MSLTRQQKEKTVIDMQQNITDAASVVFVAFDGLNVEDVTDLRAKLAEDQNNMRVVPKRLLKLVMKNTKLDFDPRAEEGQIAVIWGNDATSPAKILYEFTEGHENLRLLSGALDGSIISFDEVISLAKLPNKEQLLGQLVGVLAGPMRGFASVLSGVPRQAVYVLQAIADQKEINK